MTTEDLKFREFGLAESGRPHGLYLDDGGRQRPLLLKIEEGVPPGTPAYGYVMGMAKGFRIRRRRDTGRILARSTGGIGGRRWRSWLGRFKSAADACAGCCGRG